MKVLTRFAGSLAVLFLAADSLNAQVPYAPKVLSVKDYKQAEKYMDRKWSSLVYGAGVQPSWTDNEQFTYRTSTAAGPVAYLLNAKKKSKMVSEPEKQAASPSA